MDIKLPRTLLYQHHLHHSSVVVLFFCSESRSPGVHVQGLTTIHLARTYTPLTEIPTSASAAFPRYYSTNDDQLANYQRGRKVNSAEPLFGRQDSTRSTSMHLGILSTLQRTFKSAGTVRSLMRRSFSGVLDHAGVSDSLGFAEVACYRAIFAGVKH